MLAETISPVWQAGKIQSASLHSQCNSVKFLASLSAHASALWKGCSNVHVMSVLIGIEKNPIYSGLKFDDIERQGKTISLHSCKGLFLSFSPNSWFSEFRKIPHLSHLQTEKQSSQQMRSFYVWADSAYSCRWCCNLSLWWRVFCPITHLTSLDFLPEDTFIT